MSIESKAAFINSQATCAIIEMTGMVAENQQRLFLGQPIAYNDKAFFELIDKYGLGHNSVLVYLQEE